MQALVQSAGKVPLRWLCLASTMFFLGGEGGYGREGGIGRWAAGLSGSLVLRVGQSLDAAVRMWP